jgi:hypothetical protein
MFTQCSIHSHTLTGSCCSSVETTLLSGLKFQTKNLPLEDRWLDLYIQVIAKQLDGCTMKATIHSGLYLNKQFMTTLLSGMQFLNKNLPLEDMWLDLFIGDIDKQPFECAIKVFSHAGMYLNKQTHKLISECMVKIKATVYLS